MRTLQSILLPTNFRTSSRAAVNAAVKLAWTFGSRITLLHAVERVPNWPIALHEQAAQKHVREITVELARQHMDPAEASIVVGPPAATILDKAQQIDADLILMGAGEQVGDFRFSTGTIAQTVIEHAPQPVLAVRPGQPELTFRKIVCPIDQSRLSANGLNTAIKLARLLGSEVVVLTVVPDVSWLSAAVETQQFDLARAEYVTRWREEFERFVAGIPTRDVKTTIEVRHGAPGEEIVAAVESHGGDLVVMGATGRTGLVRVLLGSTTRRVLQRLPCSLLVIKHEDLFVPEKPI